MLFYQENSKLGDRHRKVAKENRTRTLEARDLRPPKGRRTSETNDLRPVRRRSILAICLPQSSQKNMTQSDPLLIQTHPHHPPSAHHHFPLCLATENSFSSKKSPPVHSNAAPQDLSLKASMNQQQPHQKDLTMSPPVPAAPAQQLVQEGAGSSASSAAAAARAASLHSSLSSSPGSENYENLSFPK